MKALIRSDRRRSDDLTMKLRNCAAVILVLLALMLGGCAETPDLPLSGRISNTEEIVTAIRHGLKNHAKSITISFDYGMDIFGEINGAVDDWIEAALAETKDPAEGDYLRYQYGGYTTSVSYVVDDRWRYTVKITPDYYCYLSQEEQAEKELLARVKSFGFMPWSSDYEKIEVIYQNLCQTVRYDKVHRKNPYYHIKSTAYAAMIQHNATCQGYCVCLYRMLRETGISCRIVTGKAGADDLHAWVIAELDGLYYILDPTWDAGNDTYQWLLRGEDNTHVPGEDFLAEAFQLKYESQSEFVFPLDRRRATYHQSRLFCRDADLSQRLWSEG